jgi:predicted nucleic acid-binding protein
MTTTSGWVVDASVVLKWSLRDEEFLEQADGLYEAFVDRSIDLVAPYYVRYEVANSLEVARLQGRIDAPSSEQRLRLFFQTGIGEHEDDDTLVVEAMRLAGRHTIAFYDALYLALADRLDYAFVTADRRLHQRLAPEVEWVQWIGEVSAVP